MKQKVHKMNLKFCIKSVPSGRKIQEKIRENNRPVNRSIHNPYPALCRPWDNMLHHGEGCFIE